MLDVLKRNDEYSADSRWSCILKINISVYLCSWDIYLNSSLLSKAGFCTFAFQLGAGRF